MHRLVLGLAFGAHIAFVAFVPLGGFVAWAERWVIVPHVAAVVWAVGIQAVLAPTLLFYLGSADELGMRFTTFSLALAAIGLFVMLMGRVLEAAAAIKADSDQIV